MARARRIPPSQQSDELVYTEPGLPDDGWQRASIQFLMVGNHDLTEGLVATQNEMAPMLPLQGKPDFAESFDAGRA